MLGTWLLHYVDARLEMLPSIIVKNNRASVFRICLGRQGVNERSWQGHHSSLSRQPFIHCPLKNCFGQFCLRGGLSTKQRFPHIINRGISRGVAVLENDAELTIQCCWQNLGQDTQII